MCVPLLAVNSDGGERQRGEASGGCAGPQGRLPGQDLLAVLGEPQHLAAHCYVLRRA